MKWIHKNLIIVTGVLLSVLAMLVLFTYLPRHGAVVYNCSIAEISPDIPVAVKEQCRKLKR